MFRKRKIRMTKSVGSFVAGSKVKLDVADADEMILKGYAEGGLSRPYSEEEAAALRGPIQTVRL